MRSGLTKWVRYEISSKDSIIESWKTRKSVVNIVGVQDAEVVEEIVYGVL